ncbi:WYL domain-containing protein [uncultured Helicobacter sp.]|uniref:helix-turn-helix transcriptional regulator n=1 Tax=uncultured Helicobacter sp. TaxID=175537 RepID=UPI002615BF68|nr:WYL domain-containing protein [uncultured Helicobacter sp.]
MNHSLQRLIQIIQRLYRGEKLKISQLAKEFNVSTKTIQRDLKERLKSSLLIKDGHNFYLSPKARENSDDFILDFLFNLAPHYGDEFSYRLTHILSKYQAIKNDNLFLSLQTPSITQKLQEIQAIQMALSKQTYIKLHYKSALLSHIIPIKIQAINGVWYLFALQEERKLFLSLSQITEVKAERKRFTLSEEAYKRFESEFFDTPKILVSLFVYPQIAQEFQLKKFATHQKIIQDKEGSLIIEFLSNNLEGIEQEILKHIPNVAVLEPQELKDSIESKIKLYTSRCNIL